MIQSVLFAFFALGLTVNGALAGDITSDTISNADALASLKQALNGKGIDNSLKVNSIWGVFQEGRHATIYFTLSGLMPGMRGKEIFNDATHKTDCKHFN